MTGKHRADRREYISQEATADEPGRKHCGEIDAYRLPRGKQRNHRASKEQRIAPSNSIEPFPEPAAGGAEQPLRDAPGVIAEDEAIRRGPGGVPAVPDEKRDGGLRRREGREEDGQ